MAPPFIVTTAVLDTFNRADGALGTRWIDPAFASSNASSISSGLLRPPAAGSMNVAWSTPFGPLREIQVIIDTLPTIASTLLLIYEIDNPNSATWNGWQWSIPLPTSVGLQTITRQQVTAGVPTNSGTSNNKNVGPGIGFAATIQTDDNYGHALYTKDTNTSNAAWAASVTFSGNPVIQVGSIGLGGTLDNGQRFREFGGGNRIIPIRTTPQSITSGMVW